MFFPKCSFTLQLRWYMQFPWWALGYTVAIAFSKPLCLSVINTRSSTSPYASLNLWKNQVYETSFSVSAIPKAKGYICSLPSKHDAINKVPLYFPFKWVPSTATTGLTFLNPAIVWPKAMKKYRKQFSSSVSIWVIVPGLFASNIEHHRGKVWYDSSGVPLILWKAVSLALHALS